MNKQTGIYGFLALFLLIFSVGYGGNQLIFKAITSDLPEVYLWLYSISQVTLTHLKPNAFFNSQAFNFHLFSTLITYISSLFFHSILLWLCWQLFGSTQEKSFTLTKSITITFLVATICEFLLLIFFLYAIPVELTDGSFAQKMLAALTLSINSFNNAGLSNLSYFFGEEILAGNFMIQIGVIGGTVLGSLGIFVIIDLFSPIKLRQRLADPSIDWNFVTKLSVFGSAILMSAYVALFFLLGDSSILSDKNILESLSFVLLEGVGARGFGLELMEWSNSTFSSLNLALSFFGAGPFSTGGGATLLFAPFLYGIFKDRNQLSLPVKTALKIVKIWLVIGITYFFTTLILVFLFPQISIPMSDLFYLYTNHHLELSSAENVFSGALKTITSVVGRGSFIASCIIVINQNKHASGIF